MRVFRPYFTSLSSTLLYFSSPLLLRIIETHGVTFFFEYSFYSNTIYTWQAFTAFAFSLLNLSLSFLFSFSLDFFKLFFFSYSLSSSTFLFLDFQIAFYIFPLIVFLFFFSLLIYNLFFSFFFSFGLLARKKRKTIFYVRSIYKFITTTVPWLCSVSLCAFYVYNPV